LIPETTYGKKRHKKAFFSSRSAISHNCYLYPEESSGTLSPCGENTSDKSLMTGQKFPKKEKLKSKKLFELLFEEGQSVASYPIKLLFVRTELSEDVTIQVGVTVAKKNFKSAVKRNRIKRLVRESYRLNKHRFFNNIEGSYAFLFLYIGKEIHPYMRVERSMLGLIDKFFKKVTNEKADQ
jgi:ribonuclease P protein component